MKLAEDLKKAVLQAAMQGKLTKQLESDSSVDELLKKIAEEKAKLIAEGKIKKTEKFTGPLTEEEYPFEIPVSWKFLKIPDATIFQEGPGILGKDFRTNGIPLIRIAGMQEKIVHLTGCNYLDPEMVEKKWKHFKLDLGDVVISSSASMDKIAEVDEETVGAIAYTGLIRFKMLGEINKEFFKYYIQSPFYIQQINEQKAGGMIQHYGPTHLQKMFIPIPPIEEQQRIVEKLNQILPLIDEYGKEEDELIALCQKFPGKMKKSVLQAAMQGKLTKQLESDSSVDELLKKIAEEKAKLIAEGKIKKDMTKAGASGRSLAEITEEEIPFDIPETWRWCRLGVIGTFLRGSGIKRTETVSEGFPCIRYGELYTTYRTNFSKIKSFVLKSIYEKAFKIEKDDICMALTGENKFDIALASVYQGDTPIAMGGDMTRFRIIFGNPLYFVYAINSPYGINCKQQLATGDIICHISNDKLANIPFPVPPIEEQQRIVEKLNTILPIIDSMAVYGTKKKAGRPKQEEALAFISSLLGTQKSTDSKPVSPEILDLKAKAKEELPAIVKKYANLMKVSYNRITIRHQKTRWGSCTKTGNLSFNCLLMKMPENVRDYVIIHELAHRKELNHSTKFWAIVAEYCPWYKEAKQWLKDNGQGLMEK